MGKYVYKYEELDLDDIPRKGYVIIDKIMVLIEDNEVIDSWELEGDSINELIHDAREQSGMGGAAKIWVDTDNLLDADEVLDRGKLIHDFHEFDDMDDEEVEGWIDLAEHLMGC